MVRFKNLVLGTPEDTPDNVVAGRAARGYGQDESQGQNNNTATNTPSTPVAKVQPVSIEPKVNTPVAKTGNTTTSAPLPTAAKTSTVETGATTPNVNASPTSKNATSKQIPAKPKTVKIPIKNGKKSGTVDIDTSVLMDWRENDLVKTETLEEEKKRLEEENKLRQEEEGEAVKIPHIEKYEEQKSLEDYLKQVKLMTPEEKEKALKKAKRKALFSAIGDGINALANIVGTHHGSTYIPQVSMTEKQKERWNKRMEKVKANEEKYYNIRQELAKLEDKRIQQNFNIDMMNRKNKHEDELARYEIELAENKAMNEKWQAVQSQYEAAIKEMEAASTPEELELAKENLRASIKAANALTNQRNTGAALNKARTVTEGTKQTYYRSGANKNNAQANLYNVKKTNAENNSKVVLTDGENEYTINKSEIDNNYGVLYNAILNDIPDLKPRGKTDRRTASEKKDIVRTYWGKSQSAKTILVGRSVSINGQPVEVYN